MASDKQTTRAEEVRPAFQSPALSERHPETVCMFARDGELAALSHRTSQSAHKPIHQLTTSVNNTDENTQEVLSCTTT
jgi:hypothetical protein